MSEEHKTDAELLQCSQWVDSTQFPKALSNRIAQDNGNYKFIRQTPIIYIFLSEKNFQVTSRFQYVLVGCN